ncbi:MAG: hypothetical protein LBD14_05395 [Puniceicoccales bacterium]|nr:hypothetical protein [Puniceicoccales bacterium]
MAQKTNPILYAFLIPLTGAVILLSVLFLKKTGLAGAGTLTPFDFTAYQQGWQSLEGNQYLVKCQIDRQINYDKNKGRLLAVRLLAPPRERVGVFIPSTLQRNFETGQSYNMHVLIHEGLLRVQSVEKL